MRDEKRITVDGQVYELRPWSPADGQRWLFKMLEIAGALRARASKHLAMGIVISTFSAEQLQALWGTIRHYTFRVSGEDIIDLETLETKKVSPEATPYIALMTITRDTMELEYGDFFSRLPLLLEEGTDGSRSKSPSG